MIQGFYFKLWVFCLSMFNDLIILSWGIYPVKLAHGSLYSSKVAVTWQKAMAAYWEVVVYFFRTCQSLLVQVTSLPTYCSCFSATSIAKNIQLLNFIWYLGFYVIKNQVTNFIRLLFSWTLLVCVEHHIDIGNPGAHERLFYFINRTKLYL